MAITLQAFCGEKTFVEYPDPTELEWLHSLSRESKELADASETILGGPEVGEWHTVPASKLRDATRHLAEVLKRNKGPRLFYPVVSIAPGFPPGRATGLSGLHINGVGYFELRTGLEFCELIRREVRDGVGVELDRRDLRNKRSLHTDTFGEIKIRCSRKARSLARIVRKLEKLLEGVPDDSEVKVVVG